MAIENNHKKRLLFVNLRGVMAGAEASLVSLVSGLADGYDIEVACPFKSALSREMSRLGLRCHGISAPKSRSYFSPMWLFEWLKANWCLSRIIVQIKPHVVCANNIYAATISVLPTLIFRKKLVLHCRDFSRFGLVTRTCSLFAEKVIAVSYSIREYLVKQDVNVQKIEVVYNGVDIKQSGKLRFKTALMQSQSLNERQSFCFANIGQFVPWKKQVNFVEAAVRVSDEMSNCEFLIVGDDLLGWNSKYKKTLLDKINNAPVRDRVRLSGWQSDLSGIWQKTDCLVHTAEREPFGRIIIEAMANHIPVIAINTCGPREIIENDVTGILVPPGDTEKLTEAMLKITRDHELVRQLTEAAYERVILDFNAARTGRQIKRIYDRILVA